MPQSDELTIITTHINPDYDAFASMVGARRLYPGALLVLPGGSERQLRHHFTQSLMESLGIVKIKDIDISKVRRLVVVDTRQPDRIGDVSAVLHNPGLEIHLYDHHPDNIGDMKAQMSVVADVGATVTLITELITERPDADLSVDEATIMAVGLYEDTGSFTFNSTTPRDYLAAAELLKRGADLNIVSQITVHELNSDQLAILNDLIDSAETRQIRGITFVIATAQSEHYVDDVAVLAHKMIDITGVSILFVLVAMENKVQMIIRSRFGSLNAAEVARHFGGGGHASAAAASIKGLSLHEVKNKLDAFLWEMSGRFYCARNMMIYPPITIGDKQSLAEARDILIKFSINVLLVLNDDGKMLGFISEHNVSKALYHGLLDYPVSAFMNTEFSSVSPEAGFAEIKKIIIDQKQRVLPVLEDGRPIGVITRTDLLHVLAGENAGEGAPPAKTVGMRRNLAALMREKFPNALLRLLEQLGNLADYKNVNLFAVGGCVRDLVMRKPSHDIDLTLDGDIDEFVALAAKVINVSKLVRHPRFKTATITTEEGYEIDLSTTRREYYEHPGALPVVQNGSLRMDLYRRDFTINSMAIALNKSNFGELIDFYRGFQDLKDGYIRVLHNLSFVEDPTRAFRAVRFEARLGFRISKMTANLLEGAVKNNFLTSIDRHRLLHELKIILSEEDPAPAIKRLADFKLLAYIHPQISLKPDHYKFFSRVRRVRDWLMLTFPERTSMTWLLYFLALTDQLKPQMLLELGESLLMKKKEINILGVERALADDILWRNKNHSQAFLPSEAYLIFSSLSWFTVLFIAAKTSNEELAQAAILYLSSYSKVKIRSNGDDIIALGIDHGPRIKEILNTLKLARLDGKVNSKKDELNFVVKYFIEGEGMDKNKKIQTENNLFSVCCPVNQ